MGAADGLATKANIWPTALTYHLRLVGIRAYWANLVGESCVTEKERVTRHERPRKYLKCAPREAAQSLRDHETRQHLE
jgi:hypothetical protein